ncbi:MAG: hypothetical protein MJZ61_01310 [Bacteroidales bacterium]|nr:hypothetical protein [Bacteroidales bacterium]
MDTNTLKCPGCGSGLPFDSAIGRWRCASCGSVYTDEQVLKLTADSDSDIKDQETPLNVYHCNNCGAEVLADENTSATSCAFCKSPVVLKGRLEGEFRPSKIIPFSHTRAQATEQSRTVLRTERLVPSSFTEQQCLESIDPIYIPFWLYSGRVDGAIAGTYQTSHSHYSGNYKVTETTTWHADIAGAASFTRVPADGSKKFDDAMMDSVEPFNYAEMVPFNYAYLSGFVAERYDQTADEMRQRASQRMESALSSMLSAEAGHTLSITARQSSGKFDEPEYVLLPVWILKCTFQNKDYYYAMNGQTGKMVGDTPVDNKKVRACMLKWMIGIIAAAELFWFLRFILGGGL